MRIRFTLTFSLPVALALLVAGCAKGANELAQGSGDAWAVAAWGGDIWLFSSTFEGSTSVAQVDPETGTVATVLSNVGFKVLGAGVSSCAPTEIPK